MIDFMNFSFSFVFLNLYLYTEQIASEVFFPSMCCKVQYVCLMNQSDVFKVIK